MATDESWWLVAILWCYANTIYSIPLLSVISQLQPKPSLHSRRSNLLRFGCKIIIPHTGQYNYITLKEPLRTHS